MGEWREAGGREGPGARGKVRGRGLGHMNENPKALWNWGEGGWREIGWALGRGECAEENPGKGQGPRRGSGHLRSRWGSRREACPSLS